MGYANTPEKEALRAKRISESRKGMKFTKAHREAIRKARIGTKASMDTKRNQSISMRKKACDPEWRKRVSEGTRKRMRSPEIRKRHLAGLKAAQKKHGVNFSVFGRDLVHFEKEMAKTLVPLGYVQQYHIPFGGSGSSYKLDFALVERKIAIECDGPKHRSFAQQEYDRRRDKFLNKLGWKVIRMLHD